MHITIKPNDPLDYCTKVTGCVIGPEGSTCPLWIAFLNTVMGGNKLMIDYLQRVCGYCLGQHQRTRDVLFVWHRRKRQKRFHKYPSRDNGKLSQNGTERDVYGNVRRHASD
jgi:hypothetical protein